MRVHALIDSYHKVLKRERERRSLNDEDLTAADRDAARDELERAEVARATVRV